MLNNLEGVKGARKRAPFIILGFPGAVGSKGSAGPAGLAGYGHMEERLIALSIGPGGGLTRLYLLQ